MRPLHQCRACGFLSTLGSQFTRRSGGLLDLGCDEKLRAGDPQITEWVEQAKNRAAQQ